MTPVKVQCSNCPTQSDKVRMAEKLDRNLKPEKRLLCTPCRRALGFTEPSQGRRQRVNW